MSIAFSTLRSNVDSLSNLTNVPFVTNELNTLVPTISTNTLGSSASNWSQVFATTTLTTNLNCSNTIVCSNNVMCYGIINVNQISHNNVNSSNVYSSAIVYPKLKTFANAYNGWCGIGDKQDNLLALTYVGADHRFYNKITQASNGAPFVETELMCLSSNGTLNIGGYVNCGNELMLYQTGGLTQGSVGATGIKWNTIGGLYGSCNYARTEFWNYTNLFNNNGGFEFLVNSNTGVGTPKTVLQIAKSGALTFKNDVWHTSESKSNVLHFSSAGDTYIAAPGDVIIRPGSIATSLIYINSNSIYAPHILATTQFRANSADSLASPGYTWSGDTNCGMYHPAADQIGIVTGGVQRLLVTNTGVEVSGGTLSTTGGQVTINRDIGISPDLGTLMLGSNWTFLSLRSSNNGCPVLQFQANSNTSRSFTMGIDAVNSFGGTNSGNLQIKASANFNASPILSLTTGGTLTVTGTVVSSDDRLKAQEEFITSATITLNKLRPQIYDKFTTFEYNSNIDTSIRESGFIAQEIFYEIPELRHLVLIPHDASSNVTDYVASSSNPEIDPDYSTWGTTPAGINYIGLIPYLVRSIQEKDSQMNLMQLQIDSLINRVTALESI